MKRKIVIVLILAVVLYLVYRMYFKKGGDTGGDQGPETVGGDPVIGSQKPGYVKSYRTVEEAIAAGAYGGKGVYRTPTQEEAARQFQKEKG